MVIEKRDRKGSIEVLAFSPDNTLLAAGSDEETVDFYAVSSDFSRVGFAKGLGGQVMHFDWSSDSKYIKVILLLLRESAGIEPLHKCRLIQANTKLLLSKFRLEKLPTRLK